MSFDLTRASKRLSELDIKLNTDNLLIDVSWFRVMQLDANWKINRHTHSTYEFHFIHSGSCIVSLDNSRFEVSSGEFYLTAPNVFHEQSGLGSSGLIEYCLNCDIRLNEEKSSDSQQIINVLTDTPCRKFEDAWDALKLFDMVLKEAYYQNIGFFSNIKNLVLMIIYAAARSMKEYPVSMYNAPLKTNNLDYRFALIYKYIKDNIFNQITTRDIAKYLFLSDKQVCRIIKAAKSMSTKELIEQVKFEAAENMLNTTNLSIKQISDELGFSSQYYFNQFFKRMEGNAPGIYRAKIKSEITKLSKCPLTEFTSRAARAQH